MSKRIRFLIVGLFLVGVAGPANPLPADSDAARNARGKYLVEKVAMCQDCHSPRNEKGEFDRTKWLQGAPIGVKPMHPIPHWAEVAPPLARFPPDWTEADVVKLLVTGLSKDGKPPDPPMPGYRLSPRDAAAVAAYLKSLKPVNK